MAGKIFLIKADKADADAPQIGLKHRLSENFAVLAKYLPQFEFQRAFPF